MFITRLKQSSKSGVFMKLKEGSRFIFQPPKWLLDIKDDKDVFFCIYTILFCQAVDGKEYDEKELKKQISLDKKITKDQAQEVFDLIVSH